MAAPSSRRVAATVPSTSTVPTDCGLRREGGRPELVRQEALGPRVDEQKQLADQQGAVELARREHALRGHAPVQSRSKAVWWRGW